MDKIKDGLNKLAEKIEDGVEEGLNRVEDELDNLDDAPVPEYSTGKINIHVQCTINLQL